MSRNRTAQDLRRAVQAAAVVADVLGQALSQCTPRQSEAATRFARRAKLGAVEHFGYIPPNGSLEKTALDCGDAAWFGVARGAGVVARRADQRALDCDRGILRRSNQLPVLQQMD